MTKRKRKSILRVSINQQKLLLLLPLIFKALFREPFQPMVRRPGLPEHKYITDYFNFFEPISMIAEGLKQICWKSNIQNGIILQYVTYDDPVTFKLKPYHDYENDPSQTLQTCTEKRY